VETQKDELLSSARELASLKATLTAETARNEKQKGELMILQVGKASICGYTCSQNVIFTG